MDTDLTRTMVADVERALAALEGDVPPKDATLRASWDRLVQHLALGPAPELRNCPTCRGIIRKAATRCLHCWTKSMAPADADKDGQ